MNYLIISVIVLATLCGCSSTPPAEQPSPVSTESCKRNCLEDATDCMIGCETGDYPASMGGGSGDKATCDESCRTKYASCKNSCH